MKSYIRDIFEAGIHTVAFTKGTIPGALDYLSQQSPFELEQLIELLVERGVKTYLEIGLGRGGTWTLLSRILKLKTTCGITFDDALTHLPPKGQLLLAGSEEPRAIRWAQERAPFDAILIDGRHEHEAVLEDWENYRGMGKIIIFHDICGLHGSPGSKTSWEEIASHSEVLAEIIDPVWPLGLGVIVGGAS